LKTKFGRSHITPKDPEQRGRQSTIEATLHSWKRRGTQRTVPVRGHTQPSVETFDDELSTIQPSINGNRSNRFSEYISLNYLETHAYP